MNKRQLKPLHDVLAKSVRDMPDTYIMELHNYIGFGFKPGSFHMALYSNNLRAAVRHTDSFNKWDWICGFIKFLEHEAPSECWGSRDRVEKWIKLSREDRFEILHRKGLVLTEEEVTWAILKENPENTEENA